MDLKSKREAAEILGISTRGIERAVRRGQLSVQYRRSKHGKKAWFLPIDLDRYKRQQQAREPLGFTSGIPGQPPAPGPHVGSLIPMVEIEPRHSKAHGRDTVPIADRLALNLDEAAQLSGLPRSFIVQSIHSRKLHSIKIGRSQYVKRTDLNKFVQSL